MNMQAEFVIASGILIFLLWIAPLVLVYRSPKTRGSEKAGWLLAIAFISWFAWIFYILLAPIKKDFKQA